MSLIEEYVDIRFRDQIVLVPLEGRRLGFVGRAVNWAESVVTWRGHKIEAYPPLRADNNQKKKLSYTYWAERTLAPADKSIEKFFPVTLLVALVVKSLFRSIARFRQYKRVFDFDLATSHPRRYEVSLTGVDLDPEERKQRQVQFNNQVFVEEIPCDQ